MKLQAATPEPWIDAVRGDFDSFLLDHAACERKASATAMGLVAHYPDRIELVRSCIALAREELEHFARVWEMLSVARDRPRSRHSQPIRLPPRPRVPQRKRRIFSRPAPRHRDRRSARLRAIRARARALPGGETRDFYRELARSEVRHHEIYLELARTYFPADEVERRLEELLAVEARIVRELPIRAAMY
jgi:tRNA-(ms[2]io[6]A)-hydroxylase